MNLILLFVRIICMAIMTRTYLAIKEEKRRRLEADARYAKSIIEELDDDS
jgi:hypothetical protein